MSESLYLEKGRKEVIERLRIIFSDSELDFDKIDNTRLWDLEEKIGVNHFSFCESVGRRSGHIPIKIISKKEIQSLIDFKL